MRLKPSGGESRGPARMDLLEDGGGIVRDIPARVVSLRLAEIADVADVVAFAVLVGVFVDGLAARDLLGEGKGLEDRAAVAPPAADVVDLAGPWGVDEALDE